MATLQERANKGDIDAIYQLVQQKYGAIDAIFKSNEALKKLLIRAYKEKLTAPQFVKELQLTDWFKKSASIIQQNEFYRRQWQELTDKGQDASKSEYGIRLTATRDSLTALAKQMGATITEADADKIAKELLAVGQESSVLSQRNRLASFIKYNVNATPGTDATTGDSSDYTSELRKTALANGIKNFDAKFGNAMTGWLQELAKGESLETIKQRIRAAAATGLPDQIASQMAQGTDLETVIDPYRRTMAAVLEVPEETIDMSDPALVAAFRDNPMNLFDYEKTLRKDGRWQYTGQARTEVSNIALQILRDFGFTG